MRVGFYVAGLPPEAGGGHTYVRSILSALAATAGSIGHQFIATGYSPDPPVEWGTLPYVPLRIGVATRALGQGRRTIRTLLRGDPGVTDYGAGRALRGAGVDLVWSLGNGTPTFDLPYVATVWDLQHRLQPVFPEVSGEEWVGRERRLWRELGQAALVVVGTTEGQVEVDRFYGVPASRTRVLAHPTPMLPTLEPNVVAATLARLGVSPGYVFYPAQFWPHKNHVAVLRALAAIRAQAGITLEAVFVGSDQANQKHVRETARTLGLERTTHFLGFVSRDDLAALYQGALLLAYASYFGPENLPPLEAFALGCPVVAANAAGVSEQLGDAAILVNPADHQALADAILTVCRDDDVRSVLIERGLDRAASYTPAHYARDIVTALDEMEPLIQTWR